MSKYSRTIKGVEVDVYDILKAFNVTNPALQHLIKKALQPGNRGHKTLEQDLNDIIASAYRAKELEGVQSLEPGRIIPRKDITGHVWAEELK